MSDAAPPRGTDSPTGEESPPAEVLDEAYLAHLEDQVVDPDDQFRRDRAVQQKLAENPLAIMTYGTFRGKPDKEHKEFITYLAQRVNQASKNGDAIDSEVLLRFAKVIGRDESEEGDDAVIRVLIDVYSLKEIEQKDTEGPPDEGTEPDQTPNREGLSRRQVIGGIVTTGTAIVAGGGLLAWLAARARTGSDPEGRQPSFLRLDTPKDELSDEELIQVLTKGESDDTPFKNRLNAGLDAINGPLNPARTGDSAGSILDDYFITVSNAHSAGDPRGLWAAYKNVPGPQYDEAKQRILDGTTSINPGFDDAEIVDGFGTDTVAIEFTLLDQIGSPDERIVDDRVGLFTLVSTEKGDIWLLDHLYSVDDYRSSVENSRTNNSQ